MHYASMISDKNKADLLEEMKSTCGARFNASKRLECRDKKAISISAIASVGVIIFTIISSSFHIGETISGLMNVTTIILSIIILVSSLLQYSNNDPVKAERHHRCALEINALRRELRASEPCSSNLLLEFGRRYDGILQRYNLNHDDVDYAKYKMDHLDDCRR